MACYRNGGCGPYEGLPCNECSASKPEYASRNSAVNPNLVNELKPTIKIKVFISEDGVSCVMKDTDLPVEIEFVDEVAVKNAARDCGGNDGEDNVDAYINQLCGDGFVYVEDDKITVTNDFYEGEEKNDEEG
jgi:hypothetical protein